MKKDRLEINSWTNDLEFLNEEIEYFLDIEDKILHNSNIYQQLHGTRRENTLLLSTLYRYEGTVGNAIECDTTDCDAYYLSHHEKKRETYNSHIQKYRILKTKILSQILLKNQI
ncbi:hypothetical protein A9200_09870 [Maribacter hydrothermalis]|uniref:Uncharacterized protein n=2 Tax=Maribacter hydrothermalis TaxID=1836467 RepID=A0A1B7Z1W2_9FLAO|nr:hypothetical protein BTR34_13975 [Maribacter hydrothermalis]OBR36711.1 hypothetical protein A9200_09870 [Maribacter hydrothermalis]